MNVEWIHTIIDKTTLHGVDNVEKAGLVLFSNAIFDSVNDAPFSGGVAISGDKIMFVGSREDVSGYICPDTVVKDFGDKLILPGFCDSHAHIDGTSHKLFAEVVNGLDALESEDECIAAIKDFVDAHPHIKRINSNSWMLTNWGADPVPPTKASLDKAIPDIPTYIYGSDGHSMWLNSKAIDECDLDGILLRHPEYPPEWVIRDADGNYSGMIFEDLAVDVHEFAEIYTQEERARFHTETVKYFSKCGLTGITEVLPMKCTEIISYYSRLKELDNMGELPIRIYMWHGLAPRNDDTATIDADYIKDLMPFFNTDTLRIAGIKTNIDGIPFHYTSAMLEPYSDDPSVSGSFLNAPGVYLEWVSAVNGMGFSVKTHCTGDAAVRLALDCFEKSLSENGDRDFRNAIEHMDMVTDEDIPRFAKLGVIASVQPAHLIMCKGIGMVRYGERAYSEWPFRKLIDAGARIAIGTDMPVVECDPYLTIYKAVTRKDIDGSQYSPHSANQALSLPEVLKGYTIGGAYNNRMEEKVGTLEAGKYADIIVADKNLFAIPAEEIKDCCTILTVFNGRIVYEN